ncbi:MAG: DUF3298 and DUF4163 domain-containing protein [Dysgonamonadaceae bacterium]|jgi:hypothetical protein|nr:DUF3298 and DUF4163 domain-containing protein [Dysgonamonadaceae bacterium]
MKKNIALLVLSCFLYSLLALSCIHGTGKNDNNIQMDTVQIVKTYYFMDDTLNHACNLQISFVYPYSADKEILSIIQDIFVEKVLGYSFVGLSPKKAANSYLERYIQLFKDFETEQIAYSFLPKSKDETDYTVDYEENSPFSHYAVIKNTVVYNQNNFISFIVENTSYEGGAHSSNSIYGYVIDLKNKCLLTEEDFTGLNYEQNLSQVIAAKIADANDIDNPEELENLGYFGINDICPNNNFTIDAKGITYYFNENEIAGSMVGLTSVFIPYSEIDIYLKNGNPLAALTR